MINMKLGKEDTSETQNTLILKKRLDFQLLKSPFYFEEEGIILSVFAASVFPFLNCWFCLPLFLVFEISPQFCWAWKFSCFLIL